jgi:hypothetical protein
VNAWDIMPVLLLVLFGVALSIGMGIIVAVFHRAKGAPAPACKEPEQSAAGQCRYEPRCIFHRPNYWLAIKSRSLLAVQSALGLHNVKPCSWLEGLSGDEKLFISPPVKGWILVMGSGVPDPAEDVDACFRFVLGVSRKLGQVQLFSANRVLHYHAWIRADAGRVVRAYSWAGKTLWQQGKTTHAERELGLKSFGYTELVEHSGFGPPDVFAVNTEKVPLLAARWSLDPARVEARCIETEQGVAGEPSRRY